MWQGSSKTMNVPPGQNPYVQNPYVQSSQSAPPHAANPYAPPEAAYAAYGPSAQGGFGPALGAPLTSALYSPNHVSLATFLGTPLGGAVLMALNENRLGRQGAAIKTLALGALASACLFGLGFALPEGVPTFPIGLGSLLLMGYIARQRHGQLVRHHLASGGKAASGWAAAGIGLLSLVVLLVPLTAIVVVVTLATGQ